MQKETCWYLPYQEVSKSFQEPWGLRGWGQESAQDSDSQGRKKSLSAGAVSLTQDIFSGASMELRHNHEDRGNKPPIGGPQEHLPFSAWILEQYPFSRRRKQIRDLFGAVLNPYYRPQPFPFTYWRFTFSRILRGRFANTSSSCLTPSLQRLGW